MVGDEIRKNSFIYRDINKLFEVVNSKKPRFRKRAAMANLGGYAVISLELPSRFESLFFMSESKSCNASNKMLK